MKEYQTPSIEPSQSSDRKLKESQLKKPQKQIAKKSLNGVFSSVIADISPEINKESSDLSPVSEISDASNYNKQTADISKLSVNPALSASTETFSLSDLTPASKISTIIDEPGSVSVENHGFSNLCGPRIGLVERLEADAMVKLLKQARIEVSDADIRSKKLLDALIEVVIAEFYTLPQEKDWIMDLVSMKGRIVCLCFLIWSSAVFMLFLFGSGLGSSDSGALPT